MIIEYSDNCPVILHDSKNSNSRNESVTNGIKSAKKRPCKSSFQNCTQKYINLNNSSDLSLANNRISVAKHDFEWHHWKITTNKGNNTDALCKGSDSKRHKEDMEETSKTTRIKKKRRFLTICTVNCKYDVVRRMAMQFRMKEVTEDSSWDLYWTDQNINVERIKDMKRFQRVNHFLGMTEICRKDLLARNLNRMQKLFPKDYNFFPKTWCFPAE